MKITAKTNVCMIIGDPVEHSLSPQIHNAAYKALGIDDQFVFVAAHVKPEDLAQTLSGVRAMHIRGLTCTIPHKTTVMHYLDAIDETARKIGAVNTIVNENGKLTGYNTDWLGVVTPLEKVTTIKDKKVAVIGAGGAARAVVYGIFKHGGKVTIFNRTIKKAKQLAEEFGCAYAANDDFAIIKDMDIIFNATSVGLDAKKDETPLPKVFITNNHIVFDAIYVPYETQLLKDAKEKGAQVIHGLEMLLYQGMAQFQLYTNQIAPEDVMRKLLMEKSH